MKRGAVFMKKNKNKTWNLTLFRVLHYYFKGNGLYLLLKITFLMPNKRKRGFSFSLLPVDAKLELNFRCNLLVGMASLCDKGLQKQALFNDYMNIIICGFELMQSVAVVPTNCLSGHLWHLARYSVVVAYWTSEFDAISSIVCILWL